MADERMQTGRGIKPVVGNTRLPRMTDTAPQPTPVGGKTLLMAAKPKADTGKTKRMPPSSTAVLRQTKTRPDMEAPKAKTAARAKEGYVRLRLRVTEGGRLTVVGAKAVEGELVEPKLQGALAYEAALGPRRIAAGGIPDVGEQRSFPDPKATLPEMKGHHVTELASYEVNVRVPKGAVKAAELPKLEVALFRIKETCRRTPRAGGRRAGSARRSVPAGAARGGPPEGHQARQAGQAGGRPAQEGVQVEG